ncbi:MAG TPA: sigma 54-interacting transcriptional regulator [Polyangiaceae bacterium]|nr:sigma 54-interacting transcriptional regulator [Polyangiaceae bacterium]
MHSNRLSASADGTERQLPPLGPDTSRLLVVARDGTWSAHELPAVGSLTFGRGIEADVRVHEPSVSRLHAKLVVQADGQYALTDLGSANGTAVGGELIRSTTVDVKPGVPILLGGTVIVLQVPIHAASQQLAPSREQADSPVSAAMAHVDALFSRVAPTQVNVLLLGETGVGKDVFAERLHRLSTRCQGPLLRLNCAGMAPALLESELFGHEKGAFTGAVQAKKGLLEVASGGTVLLDEIAEMPLEVQAKLLLALELRVMRRLGSTQDRPIDVRFICATHRDLQVEMQRERFRADFYFRINGVTIRIPPLRERLDELEGLVAQFARETSARLGSAEPPAFDASVLGALHRYHWPGNIRELRNVVERAVIFSDGRRVTEKELVVAELPRAEAVAGTGSTLATAAADEDSAERERIMSALAECGGNQSRAAKRLGISRNTLIARIREFGLVRPRGRERAPGD